MSTREPAQIASFYPKLQPFMYSLDTFTPLISLDQADYWFPNAELGTTLSCGPLSITTGSLLRSYHVVSHRRRLDFVDTVVRRPYRLGTRPLTGDLTSSPPISLASPPAGKSDFSCGAAFAAAGPVARMATTLSLV